MDKNESFVLGKKKLFTRSDDFAFNCCIRSEISFPFASISGINDRELEQVEVWLVAVGTTDVNEDVKVGQDWRRTMWNK